MDLADDFENLSPMNKFLLALTVAFSLIIGNMQVLKIISKIK